MMEYIPCYRESKGGKTSLESFPYLEKVKLMGHPRGAPAPLSLLPPLLLKERGIKGVRSISTLIPN